MDYRVIKYNNVIWKLTCRLFEIQIGSFTLVRLNTFFSSVSLVIICSCLLAVWFGSSFAWCFKFYKNNGLYSEKVKYVKHLYFFFWSWDKTRESLRRYFPSDVLSNFNRFKTLGRQTFSCPKSRWSHSNILATWFLKPHGIFDISIMFS